MLFFVLYTGTLETRAYSSGENKKRRVIEVSQEHIRYFIRLLFGEILKSYCRAAGERTDDWLRILTWWSPMFILGMANIVKLVQENDFSLVTKPGKIVGVDLNDA